MDGRTHGRTDDGRKVITIAHPEQRSGELKTKECLFQVEEINIGISSKVYAFSHMMHEKLGSKSTSSLYTFIKFENDKIKVEKKTKINLKIISKTCALLQIREKTCAKFQRDRFKIV